MAKNPKNITRRRQAAIDEFRRRKLLFSGEAGRVREGMKAGLEQAFQAARPAPPPAAPRVALGAAAEFRGARERAELEQDLWSSRIREELNTPIRIGSGAVFEVGVPQPVGKNDWDRLRPEEKAVVQKLLDEVKAVSRHGFQLTGAGPGDFAEYEKSPQAGAILESARSLVHRWIKGRQAANDPATLPEPGRELSRGFGATFTPAIATSLSVAGPTGEGQRVNLEPVFVYDEETGEFKIGRGGQVRLGRGSAPVDPVTREERAAGRELWSVSPVERNPLTGTLFTRVRISGDFTPGEREVQGPRPGEEAVTGFRRQHEIRVELKDPATMQPLMDPDTGEPLKDPDTGKPLMDPGTGKPLIPDAQGHLRISIERRLPQIALDQAKMAMDVFIAERDARSEEERGRSRKIEAEERLRSSKAKVRDIERVQELLESGSELLKRPLQGPLAPGKPKRESRKARESRTEEAVKSFIPASSARRGQLPPLPAHRVETKEERGPAEPLRLVSGPELAQRAEVRRRLGLLVTELLSILPGERRKVLEQLRGRTFVDPVDREVVETLLSRFASPER